MPLLTGIEARSRARLEQQRQGFTKSANRILEDRTRAFNPVQTYTIFLSHSFSDAEIVLGVKGIIEDLGHTVYVDWTEDPQLDRRNVTPATAAWLQGRMRSCRSLFYLTSENSELSKWMPWETGYFDGFRGKVAVMPIQMNNVQTNTYRGQEYLGLYPYAVFQNDTTGRRRIWIYKSPSSSIAFEQWLEGPSSIFG